MSGASCRELAEPSEQPIVLGHQCGRIAVLEVPKGLPEAYHLDPAGRRDDDRDRVELTIAAPALEDPDLERLSGSPAASLRPVEHHRMARDPREDLRFDV